MSGALAPFVPPFCPRTACRHHLSSHGWRWHRHGHFTSASSPGRIPRFRCGSCGHTFSSQTFSTTYWLRRPELLAQVFHRLNACSGYRQIARGLDARRCAHTTVLRHASRLGRHALLYLWQHRPRGPIPEPLVSDGFESFAYSQYLPLHLNLVVGAHSHFCYAFTHCELRRKGRMRPAQKRRRAGLEARYGRPDPRAIERAMAAALRLAVPEPQAFVWRTDEHDAYPRARRRLLGYDITHERTSSLEARTPGNPLFPVNLKDLLLRHNGAQHKRETIAFSKRHQSTVERAAILFAWLDYMKPFSERHGGGTPAMRLGIQARPVTMREFLRWRLFPERVRLPEPWRGYYAGEVVTRCLRNEKRHRLKLAA
jgi:transposase-like protein